MTDFEKAVETMRFYQMMYFKSRSLVALQQAKLLEREVDKMLNSIKAQEERCYATANSTTM